MKLKTLTIRLATVTALACSAAGAAAQQALPQSAPPNDYRANPTPEEMEKTKALNAKQAEIRGVTAAGATGSAIEASDQKAQQQYQEELRVNEEQRKLYQQQMKEYERKYGPPGTYAPAKS
jgi:hypothetical protein